MHFLSLNPISGAQGTDVRFQVLMAASMKMTAFCNITPCRLILNLNIFVEIYLRRLWSPNTGSFVLVDGSFSYCLQHQFP
jgi:hypothetical protein